MINVELNKTEYEFLHQVPFLSKIEYIFSLDKQSDDKYFLNISESQADEIRDLCGDQLQLIGFDEKYELTVEGKILESLIDKFFVE